MEDIRKGTCPLCRHREIVVSMLSAVGADAQSPVVVAAEQISLGESPVIRPRGRLSSHMCRRCGFTQLFANDPGNVPIGPRFGTTLLTPPEAQGPYR
jgi:hypothetical protein